MIASYSPKPVFAYSASNGRGRVEVADFKNGAPCEGLKGLKGWFRGSEIRMTRALEVVL